MKGVPWVALILQSSLLKTTCLFESLSCQTAPGCSQALPWQTPSAVLSRDWPVFPSLGVGGIGGRFWIGPVSWGGISCIHYSVHCQHYTPSCTVKKCTVANLKIAGETRGIGTIGAGLVHCTMSRPGSSQQPTHLLSSKAGPMYRPGASWCVYLCSLEGRYIKCPLVGMVRRPSPLHLSPLGVGGGGKRGRYTNTMPSEGEE